MLYRGAVLACSPGEVCVRRVQHGSMSGYKFGNSLKEIDVIY